MNQQGLGDDNNLVRLVSASNDGTADNGGFEITAVSFPNFFRYIVN